MKFEWDNARDKANIRKHGVSFNHATEAFADSNALDIFDNLHSEFEDRFITIGRITEGLVVVVWTEYADDVIRIISARPATKREATRFHAQTEREYE